MWSTGKPQQHWPKYVKTSETIKRREKVNTWQTDSSKNVKPEKLFFPPCSSCFFHTWGGFFMDAGYISLRLEAVSLQTAHQDEWQLWGRELDQLRRRRPGLTIHFLPQSENLHIVATTQKSLARKGKVGKKNLTDCWIEKCCFGSLHTVESVTLILIYEFITDTSFTEINCIWLSQWLSLMALVNVPFCSQSMWRALELCNSLKRKLQIRGNLWLSPSMISPTFEASVTRDELFEEKTSWLLSILYVFGGRSIALHQIL